MYFFSSLALTLNEEEDGVCVTDSRLRPDQRLMEEGRWDEANMEKQRLEEKQRAVRRRREAEASDAMDLGENRNGGPIRNILTHTRCCSACPLGYSGKLLSQDKEMRSYRSEIKVLDVLRLIPVGFPE